MLIFSAGGINKSCSFGQIINIHLRNRNKIAFVAGGIDRFWHKFDEIINLCVKPSPGPCIWSKLTWERGRFVLKVFMENPDHR
jgi:hypothetical protein